MTKERKNEIIETVNQKMKDIRLSEEEWEKVKTLAEVANLKRIDVHKDVCVLKVMNELSEEEHKEHGGEIFRDLIKEVKQPTNIALICVLMRKVYRDQYGMTIAFGQVVKDILTETKEENSEHPDKTD